MSAPVINMAWTDREALPSARAAARAWGLEGEPSLLALSNNATFLCDGVIVKVTRPGLEAIARREADLCRALAAAGAPVAAPEAVPQLTAQDHLVTAWQFIPSAPGSVVDEREFGRALAEMHDAAGSLDLASLGVGEWAQLERIATRLDILDRDDRYTHEEVACLRSARDSAVAQLHAAGWAERNIELNHGDPHRGNAIASPGGVVLIDLENAALGPHEVDIACIAISVTKFGRPQRTLDEFLAGFARKPTEMLAPLIRLKELSHALWFCALDHSHPERHPKCNLYLESFTGQRAQKAWGDKQGPPQPEAQPRRPHASQLPRPKRTRRDAA